MLSTTYPGLETYFGVKIHSKYPLTINIHSVLTSKSTVLHGDQYVMSLAMWRQEGTDMYIALNG